MTDKGMSREEASAVMHFLQLASELADKYTEKVVRELSDAGITADDKEQIRIALRWRALEMIAEALRMGE